MRANYARNLPRHISVGFIRDRGILRQTPLPGTAKLLECRSEREGHGKWRRLLGPPSPCFTGSEAVPAPVPAMISWPQYAG